MLLGKTLAVALESMNSSPLRSRHAINLIVGHMIEIHETGSEIAQHRFAVRINAYIYGFTRIDRSGDEVEILHFHWDRLPSPGNLYPPGHLHLGQGILAKPTFLRAGDFHRAHVPTGRVSLESIIRFAITELEVEPLNGSWARVLADTESQTMMFTTS